MENVAIHGMGGNDAYKVVPKYKKISKINEITIHHVYVKLSYCLPYRFLMSFTGKLSQTKFFKQFISFAENDTLF